MSEQEQNWSYGFWKHGAPKSREDSSRVTLASSTEAQEDVEDALGERVQREREPSFIYTEMQPAEQEQDGSTEHTDPLIVTDVRARKADDGELLLAPMTPGTVRTYDAQVSAATAVIPDFVETLNQAIPIPQLAAHVIRTELPNGAMVSYYLGKHRRECAKLCEMTPKQIQARLVEISADVATNPAAGLDTADYATFRRVRNAQVKNLHR